MASKATVVKSIAGGALAIALGALGFLEGYGPEPAPGMFKSYTDIAGVETICKGHTGPDVKRGMIVPRSVCEDLATKDLMVAFQAEDDYLDHPEDLASNVRAAAALFILNVGREAFRTSTFRRLLIAHDISRACWSLMAWTKARAGPMGQLVTVTGLVNRRTFERKLCLGENP
jgi:lysozyme